MYDVQYHHDPVRQAHFLRESIQSGKKPLGFFLGAGCPMAVEVLAQTGGEELEDETPQASTTAHRPLVPDITMMTKAILTKLESIEEYSESIRTLHAHLSADDASPNLEDYLTFLRTLISVSGGEEVRGLKAKDMEAIEKALCDEIFELVNVTFPDSNGPYHRLARWIGSVDREHSVEVFTTNYDLLMEQALEQIRVPYFDGFIGSRDPFFDPFAIDEEEMPSRWAGLWKLHGSINWKQDAATGRVTRCDVAQINAEDRRLIHPTHLKYDQSRRMPYLAMIDRLKAFFRRPSCLLVTIGY